MHISEEATNASVAVPWAMMGACSIGGVLGWGACPRLRRLSAIGNEVDADWGLCLLE